MRPFTPLPDRIYCWLYVLVPLAVWAVLYAGFSFNGLYGQDAHAYFQYSQALAAWMQGGEFPGKFFWPVMYPLYGAGLSALLGKGPLALQAVSVFALVGAAFLIRAVLRRVWPEKQKWASGFVLIFLLGAPYVLRGSMQVMSDVFTLFFICLFGYAAIRYQGEAVLQWLVLAAFAATSAVMTRYAAGMVLLVPVAGIGIRVVSGKKWVQAVAALGVAVVVLILHVFMHGQGSFEFLGHEWLKAWSPANLFRRTFTTADGTLSYPFPNLVYGFFSLVHPGYFFPGLVLIFFLKKEDFTGKEIRIAWAAWVIYGVFLAGIPNQNSRFLLLAYPAVLLGMYPAFVRAMNLLKDTRIRRALLIGVLVVQGGLFFRAIKPFVAFSHLEQSAAAALKNQPPATVYTFYLDGALTSYHVPHTVVNLWADSAGAAQPGDLVLFHPTRFQAQWEGKPLLARWEDLRKRFLLEEVQALPEGWMLYRLGQKAEEE